MTQVRGTLNVPGPEGDVPAVIRVQFTPTRRRVVDDTVVLPVPFSMVPDEGVVVVELAATGVDWCWKVDEFTAQPSSSHTRYVVVPDSVTEVGYEDLVDVDPDTLDPVAEPEAAWSIALQQKPGWATVTTGNEPRPVTAAGIGVIWWDMRVDQSVAPVNMLDIDAWITGVIPDTEDPTPPTNLASANITSTGFDVTWDAGTDNVAVTEYVWRRNGGATTDIPASPRTLNFSGLAPESTHTVEIASKDAAGNTSTYASIEVTTDAGTSFPTHTIFDTPLGVLVKTVEAEPHEYATAFYTHTATPAGWKVKGARLYVPAGVTVPGTCEINLYAPGGPGSPVVPTLGTPTKTVTMTGIVSGAWNSVNFPTVTPVDPGEVWWIGYKFADGTWLGEMLLGAGFVPSYDGSNFVLADRVPDTGLDRNYRRIGSGATVAMTGGVERDLWLGMDATIEED